jgi:uncharacterized protein (DUF305 family)
MVVLGASAVLLTSACATATGKTQPANGGHPATATQPTTPTEAHDAHTTADSGGRGYTAADVRFMSGMIRHHAQAVLMARWAATHDAGRDVRTSAERILVSQQDEIAFMQRWLRERNEPVPDAEPSHAAMMHHTHGDMLMPGMLTEEQLAQLERARGEEFDRLFLTFMIQHHQGALTMVDELFSAPGAGQQETVFQFAADARADQAAEIERMTHILATLTPGGR